MKHYRLDTRLIHAGGARIEGSAGTPIFQSTVYASVDGEAYDAIRYPRLGTTPSHADLCAALASVSGGEAALVTASGMSAISTVLLGSLRAGDHLLHQRGLYGGTRGLIDRELSALGIAATGIDGGDPASWAAALRPETRMIYVEALSNPTLRIPDLEAIVAFARSRGLISVIDNTFASPVNLQPLALGFDLVLHSATKYLNGHSDLTAGAIIGAAPQIAALRGARNRLGGGLDALSCFLLRRGLKTLGLRVRRQNETALALARWMESHPATARVRYPGLTSHPDHPRAARLFSGGGGMIAWELRGGVAAAERLVARARLPLYAPSLGGPETLMTLPARTSHAGLTPAQRAEIGVGDGLLRISVGIEDPADLIEDLAQALE